MIKAHAGSQDCGYPVGIYIVDEEAGTRLQLRYQDGHGIWEQPPGEGCVMDPTFTLDDSAARAVLEALTRYYHGAEDTRALRKDYEAERARVDKLTVALIENHAIAVEGMTGAIAR